MKTYMITTALALTLAAGSASAQSVLERVLGSITDNTNMQAVNGVFANIAENIGTVATLSTPDQWQVGDSLYTRDEVEVIGTAWALENLPVSYPELFELPDGTPYLVTTPAEREAYLEQALAMLSLEELNAYLLPALGASFIPASGPVPSLILTAIDGSITNVLTGLDAPTADVGGVVMAVDQVTVELGDMATTVLGAVNTGDITLGVNQYVREAVTRRSSALRGSIDQIGGSVGTAALVLNVAANATSVTGSVDTTMTGLDASMGSVATTVLGAVNTGTITSGVNTAVAGIQSGIVGTN